MRTSLVIGLCLLGVSLLAAHAARREQSALPAPPRVSLERSAPIAVVHAAAPAHRAAAAHAAIASLAPHVDPPSPKPPRTVEVVELATAKDHPHPITAQHQSLRAQQQLVAALNDALDLRDAQGMRSLIERYDALSPDDPLRLAEGYERVADCIEADDPADRASARENAQRYYDHARASSLRRYVRRVCLEPGSDTP